VSLGGGTTWQAVCCSVSIMRLPRHSFLFPRKDGGLFHCEEERRGKLFIYQFQFMRLLRSYFPRNDNGLRHCEKARRGKLFIYQFQFMRLLRSYFPRNDRWVASLRGGTTRQAVYCSVLIIRLPRHSVILPS
jgi:hypothetical protein